MRTLKQTWKVRCKFNWIKNQDSNINQRKAIDESQSTNQEDRKQLIKIFKQICFAINNLHSFFILIPIVTQLNFYKEKCEKWSFIMQSLSTINPAVAAAVASASDPSASVNSNRSHMSETHLMQVG